MDFNHGIMNTGVEFRYLLLLYQHTQNIMQGHFCYLTHIMYTLHEINSEFHPLYIILPTSLVYSS